MIGQARCRRFNPWFIARSSMKHTPAGCEWFHIWERRALWLMPRILFGLGSTVSLTPFGTRTWTLNILNWSERIQRSGPFRIFPVTIWRSPTCLGWRRRYPPFEIERMRQEIQRVESAGPPGLDPLFALQCRNLAKHHEIGMIIGMGTDSGTSVAWTAHTELRDMVFLRARPHGGDNGGYKCQR